MILKAAILGLAGYVGYHFVRRQKGQHAAFADNQDTGSNFAKVRDSGPQAMADPPRQQWSMVDEASDESFPASDPPANY